MVLLIWRRRTRGKGSGGSGSAEGTLAIASISKHRAGAVPQFPVPRGFPSCGAAGMRTPSRGDGAVQRLMQSGKPKSDSPAGGRKRWHLRQPHRTLHNTPGSFHLVLYWHFYPAKPPGLFSIYSALKSVPVHGHAKCWSGLSLFWWCSRRGDLDGTGIKYPNAVDEGKQCILIPLVLYPLGVGFAFITSHKGVLFSKG